MVKMFNHFENKYLFNIEYDVTYLNVDRIHPLKQKDVADIIEQLSCNENVLLIVVFGSACDFRCNSYSDIDIYVELMDTNKKIIRDFKCASEVDLICNIDKNSDLFKEIERTGVVVYSVGGDYNV